MNFLTFALQHWKILAITGLSILLVLAGSYISVINSQKQVLETKISEKQTLLDVCSASQQGLKDKIDEQNRAIEGLAQEAELRQKKHAEELAKSRRTAEDLRKQAEDLRRRLPNPNKSVCENAEILINESIKSATK